VTPYDVTRIWMSLLATSFEDTAERVTQGSAKATWLLLGLVVESIQLTLGWLFQSFLATRDISPFRA